MFDFQLYLTKKLQLIRRQRFPVDGQLLLTNNALKDEVIKLLDALIKQTQTAMTKNAFN